MPRRRPEFGPGVAGAEAAKLEKFSDAGGTQIQWLPDAGRIQVSSRAQYKQYLETSKVCLRFLPPYSPNLNPIERLWKWMKERVIYNTYYEHFEDFKGAIFGFFAVLSTVTAESVLGQLLRG